MGVWIETPLRSVRFYHVIVTPCVGVWIETQTRMKSPRFYDVTPCVGVWIETSQSGHTITYDWSHPAWVCGLKLLLVMLLVHRLRSHPAWVCGLKLKLLVFLRLV